MTAIELLSSLREAGIRFWVEENQLRYHAPQGAMTSNLREELTLHKEEVIAFLNGINKSIAADFAQTRSCSPDEAPLCSFAQQRLWFLDSLISDTSLYNIPLFARLDGDLDVPALGQAFTEIVYRHEALRTTFKMEAGQLVQVIALSPEVLVPVVDLNSLPEAEREAETRRLAEEEARRPFDLSTGPLLRAGLLKLGEQEHVLLVTMHHIISDGWSVGVFFRELSALYNAFSQGLPSPLPALPIQYADYAVWQRERLQGEFLEEQLGYWKEKLAGVPELLELPTDHPRPPVQTFRGTTMQVALSPELIPKVNLLNQHNGTSLFMMLLAAFQVLLLRYTGQEDIVVGSPIAGRTQPETEGLIGFFVNTLPLRTDLSGDPSFRELLGRVKETCLGAYEHQELPFEKIVEELAPERRLDRNPLVQVMLAFQSQSAEPVSLHGLQSKQLETDVETAKFDLSLDIVEHANAAYLSAEYSTDLFEASTILWLLDHYRVLLEGIVSNPEACLSALPLLTEAERHQLLVEFNDTAAEYPQDKCVHQLFEEQAEKTPAAVAVMFESAQLTYGKLNEKSNQLAHYLRTLGVGPEVLVGLCLERSLEMVVGLLGVLKAGGAYVPLDPSYPKDRLAFMLEDAAPAVLLTRERLLNDLPAHFSQVLCLDRDWPEVEQEGVGNLSSGVTPQNLAYVIYTSGSTGQPKGAMNAHFGIVNRLLWMQEEYHLSPQDRVLQKTPFSFDVSVWEFFWPLLTGAQLVVARPEGHKDPFYLVETIQSQQITTLHFVPSMLSAFLAAEGVEECRSLRRVVCSGEALSIDLQERFFARSEAHLYNLYGPTEAAVDVTHWQCRPGSDLASVPIGRPVANTQVCVLDAQGQIVPIGVAGELHIGGVQVGRGYLNRPELTAEKFIPNPFGEGRLYKTGDLVKWRADGNLEFSGRLDHQVKIRGFRIELGEVEAALREHPSVKEAVVVVREDMPGDKRLVAYVVAAVEDRDVVGDLHSLLVERLPAYMVPSAFVVLEKMPLTPSGKLDCQGLPAPDMNALAGKAEYVAPRTPVEEVLCGIWAEVLGTERVGIHDNFFELGGHSLLAAQVLAKVRQMLRVDLPLRVLFEMPTVTGSVTCLYKDSSDHARADKAAQIVVRLSQMSKSELAAMTKVKA